MAILRLPLSAIVVASLLTSKAGPGVEPLTIIAVLVSHLVTLQLEALLTAMKTILPAIAKRVTAVPASAAAS